MVLDPSDASLEIAVVEALAGHGIVIVGNIAAQACHVRIELIELTRVVVQDAAVIICDVSRWSSRADI